MVDRLKIYLVTCSLVAASSVAMAQIPAFPGAEGAGAIALGGRPRTIGGVEYSYVYKVTTLDPDSDGVIPGSLRYGLNDENWKARTFPNQPTYEDPAYWDIIPRVIVFDVGGTVDLSVLPANANDIDIAPRNIYVAGQTAPGGITLHGAEFNPGHKDQWDSENIPKVNNIILRNVTVRTNNPNEKDGLWFAASNSIADHVSLSWYTDEGVSITDGARNVSLQYTIVGPGWNSPDGDGSQIEGHTPQADISVHHNLYIHNDARIPRVGEKTGEGHGPGVELDFRNNIIYNWNDSKAGYGVSGENSFSNFINNYYIGGAGSSSTTILSVPSGTGGQTHRIYQSGNLMDQNKNGSADGTDLGWTAFSGNEAQQTAPYSVPHGVTQTPDEALDSVMNYAGTNWWDRDFIDERLIDQLLTFGDSSLPVSERGQVLNTIPAADIAAVVGAPMQSRAASWDTEDMGFLPDPDDIGPLAAPAAAPGDGMPTWWELLHGLDPDVDDHAGDFDGDGYMNIEEYINEIAEWPAPDDIQWSGGIGRYAEILNWGITRSNPDEADTTTNWQPTRFDTAVIDNGTVEVDSVGQHAKFVRLATNASDNATLNITGGWLKVEDELEIGVDSSATATVSLSGGTLGVHEISLVSGGSFSMTGGVLNADIVNFDLVNDGGTIGPGHDIPTFNPSGPAPGSSVGQMHVVGNLTINGGTLQIELASDSVFDNVLVDDAAALAGDLDVSLLENYVPDAADEFEILTADTRTGDFSGATSVDAYRGFFDVEYTATSVLLTNFQLVGDYNGNGRIDAADYTVWRDSLDDLVAEGTGADGNRNGVIDEDDFSRWRANFGLMTGGGGSGQAAVPEPASISLAALCVLILAKYRWKGGIDPRFPQG